MLYTFLLGKHILHIKIANDLRMYHEFDPGPVVQAWLLKPSMIIFKASPMFMTSFLMYKPTWQFPITGQQNKKQN